MSLTPRVDAVDDEPQSVVRIFDVARQLERELNQWRKVADDLAEVVSNEMLEEYGYRRPCLQLDAYNKLKGEQK